MKNKIFNFLIVILCAVIFISFFIFSNGFSSLSNQLKTININWIILAIFCIIMFWLFETIILYIITKTLYKSEHNLFIKSIKFAMIGQLFSAITPFQSGSQPAQLYIMSENDIPAGASGSILMIKFIIHQATLTLYSILVLTTSFGYFNSKIKYFLFFCIIGFVINTLIIIFAIIFSASPTITKKALKIILKILNKIKLIKNKEKTYDSLEEELLNFHKNSAFISKNMKMCIKASVLTFLQWTVYYSIPYCIYRSFGFNDAALWTMISAQVFLTMFMSFIPLPGAAGGAEGGFYVIFGIFFKDNSIVPAIFIWRIITYYSCIAAGGLFTLILPNKKGRL